MGERTITGKMKVAEFARQGLAYGIIDKYTDREGPFEDQIFWEYNRLERDIEGFPDKVVISRKRDLPSYPLETLEDREYTRYSRYLFSSDCLMENNWIIRFGGIREHQILLAGSPEKTDELKEFLKEHYVRNVKGWRSFEGVVNIGVVNLERTGLLEDFICLFPESSSIMRDAKSYF